jgi:hypothetical protein
MMKIKDYKPTTEMEAIGWLLEECMEVGIEIGRCMRFGLDTIHEGRSNREILYAEVGDLLKAINEADLWMKASSSAQK